MVPLTVLDSLATLLDPRSANGVIHPLPTILAIVALALRVFALRKKEAMMQINRSQRITKVRNRNF